MEHIKLRGEYIKLGQVLKAAGMVEMGSDAKEVIQEGKVTVNGSVEMRRGRKIVAGDVVSFEGAQVVIEE